MSLLFRCFFFLNCFLCPSLFFISSNLRAQELEDESSAPQSEFFFRTPNQKWATEIKATSGVRQYPLTNLSPDELTFVNLKILYGYDESLNFGFGGDLIQKLESNQVTLKESFGDPAVFLLFQEGNSFISLGLTLHVVKATTKTSRLGGNQFYFSFGSDYGDENLSYGFNTQVDVYTDRRIYDTTETEYVRLEGSSGIKLFFFVEKKWDRGLLGSSLLFEYLSEIKYRNPQLGQLARYETYPAPILELYARLTPNENLHLIGGGAISLANHIDRLKFELPLITETTTEFQYSSIYLKVRFIF